MGSHGRGITIVTVELRMPERHCWCHFRTFDTCGDKGTAEELQRHLEEVPPGQVVLVAAQDGLDERRSCLGLQGQRALAAIGISDADFGFAYAAIGYAGGAGPLQEARTRAHHRVRRVCIEREI